MEKERGIWLVTVLISLCLPYLLSIPPNTHTHTLSQKWTHESFLAGAHPPVTDSRMDMNVTHMVGDKVGRSFRHT